MSKPATYPEEREKFFDRLRLEVPTWDLPPNGKRGFPPIFEELLRRFEEAIRKVATGATMTKEEAEDASEYLREIVFLDGCLEAKQRCDLGTRLLANYISATHRPTARGWKKVQDIFQIAPAADYFLAYALAWQLGWFDETEPRPTPETQPPLKILSLHSVKGGTGKTFLAHFYAAACARMRKDNGREGRKTVIVDLDFTGPTLQFLGPASPTKPTPMGAFPIFFSNQLPLFEMGIGSLGEGLIEGDMKKLAKSLLDRLTDPMDRTSLLPYKVNDRELPKDEEDESTTKEWQNALATCLRESQFLAGNQDDKGQGKIYHLVLPHRPEFLRWAGRLLEAPDWKGWRFIRRWLNWLLAELREQGFEVVIFDNAPGISNTYVIMNLVWGLNGTLSAEDRAVCIVSSPRMPDIVNTAYELLWVQAADWTRGPKTEKERRVHWVGNMWTGPNLEELLKNGKLPFLSSSDVDSASVHSSSRNAHYFAGLTDTDMRRIEVVLKTAVEKGRLVPDTVQYRSDLRKLFDFDVDPAALEMLDTLIEGLGNTEPLKTLFSDKILEE